MIAAWMVYAVVVAALFAGAALVSDRALRLVGREARWVWAAALAGSGVLPVLAARPGSVSAALDLGAVPVVARVVSAALPDPSPGLAALDPLLLVGWTAASLAVFLLLVLSQRDLRREAARAEVREMDGHPVRVTPALGPAVVGGLGRVSIVLPPWVADLDPEVRRLAVRHEAEHVRTGDVRLLAVAALAAVACPWNPAVWWQLRRLREAVELDCDSRLVRAGVDVRVYGALLLEVARRASPRRMAVALSRQRSLLSRRIDHMTSIPSTARGLRALAAAVLGALLVVLACEAPTPGADASPTATGPQLSLEDRPPRLASPLEPVYPPLLRQAGIEGDVILEFLVDASGRVDSASVVVIPGPEPVHRALEVSAARAIRGARYQPAVVNGEPAPLRIRQTVSFRLANPD